MPYYYPWMTATLEVPIYGTREERNRQAKAEDSTILPLRPFRAELELNDHNQADGLELSVDWFDAGVDPRLIDDGVVTLWMGDARGYASEYDIRDRASCRFIGLLREINTARTADSAQVHLSCIDYTTLFLEASPFGSRGIPSYDMTLRQAWQTIVSEVEGAEVLRNRIRFQGGVTGNERLGVAVSARFAGLAQVPTHPKTDAWAVWQQCVGMLGLVSFIRLDECIVTPFTNLYTESDAPVFIWGKNVLEWHESRVGALIPKGILLSSFDPETGRTIEAAFPPHESEKTKRKKAPALSIGRSAPMPIRDEDREVLQFPAVTNPEQLQKLAQQIYEERSRQELEGSVVTVEMTTETERFNEYDLLGIHAGESVRVQADPEEQSHLNSLPEGERIDYLVGRGYTREVAALLVYGMSDLHRLESKFYVKSGRIKMESTSEGGAFQVEVEYVNRIQLTGDTEGSP